MVKSTIVGITPAAHAASHASGGTDPFLHAAAHRHGGGDAVTGDVRIDAAISTKNDVSGSRAFATNYQNTGILPMFVAVVGHSSAICTWRAFTDASTPATHEIIKQSTDPAARSRSLCFWVMPNHYYQVTGSLGSLTLFEWIEWT